MVIGACLAPHVTLVPLLATLGAFFLAVGWPRTRWTSCTAGRCAPASPAAVLVAVHGASAWPARWRLGVVGVIRVGWPLVPFMVAGPVLVVAYNAELFGGIVHNDVGFAAAWGAFPVLTAYVAQTGPAGGGAGAGRRRRRSACRRRSAA